MSKYKCKNCGNIMDSEDFEEYEWWSHSSYELGINNSGCTECESDNVEEINKQHELTKNKNSTHKSKKSRE